MMKNVDILKGALIAMAIMVFHSYSLEAAEIHFFVRGSLVETQTTDNNGHVLGYTPTANGSDKPFMGWSEVNQTEPIQDPASLNLFTDFTDKVFSESTNLYAIYAVCSEGELEDKMKTNSFESQADKDFWESSANASVVPNSNGSVYSGSQAMQLKMPESSTEPIYITTKEKIEYLNKISFWIKKKGGTYDKFTAQFSTDGTEWTDMNFANKPTGASFEYTEVEATMPSIQSAYVRIKATPYGYGNENSFFVDYVTFYYKQAQHIYSDYSTDGDNATSIVIAGGTGQVELSDLNLDETKTVIVQAGGVVVAKEPITISNLAIEKVNGQSSQVLQAKNLTVTNHVYFDVDIHAAAMTWYDIAVPFTVDRLAGLSLPDGSEIPLNDVLVYNGATRAANGANGSAWEYQDAGDLVPGKGYYIMFETPVQTIRFTKKAGEKLNNEEELVETNVYASTTGLNTDANWNLVANNSLRYVNLGFTEGDNSNVIAQTYNPSADSYVPCQQDAVTYTVGTPFFVQVAKADKINWGTDETHSTLHAPMRTTNRVERFTLELSSKGEMNDRLFVSADENASNEYQIGKDVAKMGISSTIAQLWVENYNTQLCANEAVLYNDQATFPLGVFVPSNGEYTLAVTKGPDNAELYLTEDGQPVWNLSKGAYTVEMGKGTHKEYGLMLQVTDAQAPTNLNGLNERDKAVTFLKNQSIYILRNAKLYNVQCLRVK